MSQNHDDVASRIRAKVTNALHPVQLELLDESDRHIGHAGHDGRGQSHFKLIVVAEVFEGKSRVERQRLVYGALAEELADRVHALSITARAPSELDAG
ncbi:BolA family protein [Fodinicurvata sp. EGI_FJ10296]|uniref:BolA family protein n=1 Tax=Fodinicurvata sp. EGI_FJ10296 TaxID=3231908 RepID=UPI0034571665